MGLSDLLIDPAQLGAGADPPDQPLAFIDLAAWSATDGEVVMPPFPLIGFGDPSHPLAGRLDAVVEPPVTLDGLISRVSANPVAAAVAVQVLRSLEGLPADRALVFESLAFGVLQAGAEHAAWLACQAQGAQPGLAGKVRLERDGAALHVVLDRPALRNAIDHVMRDALFEAFTLANLDPDVETITLRSTGPAFSIGGELAEFGVTRDPAAAYLIRGRTLPALPLVRCAGRLEAHVQGACVGAGLEIAAFAGSLTAAPSAWFQLPELGMGLIPGAGGCVSVPRRIGRQRTALMILSGRRINARTALDWGLIDAIEDRPAVDPDPPRLDPG